MMTGMTSTTSPVKTFTVTHPDGTKSTRTSKTRIYTHAVVIETTDREALAAHFESLAIGGCADWYLARVAEVREGGWDYSVARWSATELSAVKAAGSEFSGNALPGQQARVVQIDS